MDPLIKMDLTDEYLAEQGRCINTVTQYAERGGSPERYNTIKSFCKHYKNILSIGSAGYEPVMIKATHALDVHPRAEELLRKNGWKGAFFLNDCRDLPFGDRAFECGALVEVVEHLPTGNDVILAVKELNRVCRNWILSTPIDGLHVKYHKRNLSEIDVAFLCNRTGARYKKFSRWFFMWKGKHDPEF
jgi:hypothetical protein